MTVEAKENGDVNSQVECDDKRASDKNDDESDVNKVSDGKHDESDENKASDRKHDESDEIWNENDGDKEYNHPKYPEKGEPCRTVEKVRGRVRGRGRGTDRGRGQGRG